MIRVALKGMATRRLRVVLTALSIVLGVAMVSAAFTLGDTLKKGTDSLSTAAYDGTDAAVVAEQEFVTSVDEGFERPSVPAATLDRVRAVPGVETAIGSISDQAKIVGKDGETVGEGPYFGAGLDPRDTAGAEELTPFRLADGRYASGPAEVVVDKGTAEKEKLAIGDTVKIATAGPAKEFKVSGIATFGEVKSLGTATFAIFDVRAAQELFGKQGKYDEVLVAGAAGVDPAALRADLARAVPGVDVRTATEQDRFALDELGTFIEILQKILLAFGLVAVFVGAFIIYNTLSITVAQRTRELALLRALGGSRKQVRRTVTAEALAIGSFASAIGVFAGLFIAKGLGSLFESGGVALPQSGTVFATRTWVVAVLVGVIVTLIASLAPARRATRVAPVAAMRDPSTVASPGLDRRGPAIAIATFAVGLSMLVAGAFVDGIDGGMRFLLLLPGTFVLFTGVALLAPRLVGPLASLLGAPAARFGGSAGRLARSNATRNPRRTATTASALMIGIALVAFVAVLGEGIRSSATDAIEGNTRADYVVQSQDGWTGVDRAAVDALGGTPGIDAATPVVLDEARSFEDAKTAVAGVDPQAFNKVYGLDWKQGDDSVIASLSGGGSAIVSEKYADKHGVAVGERVQLRSASGKSLDLQVAGIYESPNLSPVLLGDVLIDDASFASTFTTDRASLAFVSAGDASLASLEQSLAGFPDAKVLTPSEFATEQTKWIDEVAGIFYVMLALSVLISLFGIVNTLVLSVYERTRELGMLRAIGMTRRQVRRMVRHESVVTALIGAVMGTAVGLLLAGIVTGALSDEGLAYSVPVGSLVVFAVVAAIAGVLAAILPARRASRLNVLDALQYE